MERQKEIFQVIHFKTLLSRTNHTLNITYMYLYCIVLHVHVHVCAHHAYYDTALRTKHIVVHKSCTHYYYTYMYVTLYIYNADAPSLC